MNRTYVFLAVALASAASAATLGGVGGALRLHAELCDLDDTRVGPAVSSCALRATAMPASVLCACSLSSE
jgi:hypothetical protein